MILFRKAVFEDYYKVLSIADGQLGEGYLRGVLKLAADNFLWVAEIKESKEIIGFVFVILEDTKSIIKSIAVQNDYQGRGVGTGLISVVLESIRDKVDQFEVVAWERSDTHNIPLEVLLSRVGFEKSERRAEHWYEDSIRRGYQCPACGHPCKCDAVIFSIPSSYFVRNIG